MATMTERLTNIRSWARSEGLPGSPVQFFGMVAETPPEMRKGGRGGNSGGFAGRVTCLHRVSGVLGTSWHRLLDAHLSRQAAVEGGEAVEVVRHGRKWGIREEGTPIVTHTPEGEDTLVHYLEVFPFKRGEFKWLVDGRDATDAEVSAFMPYVVRSEQWSDVTTTDGATHRVSLYCRDYRIARIHELRMLGCVVSVEGGVVTLTHRDGRVEAIGTI